MPRDALTLLLAFAASACSNATTPSSPTVPHSVPAAVCPPLHPPRTLDDSPAWRTIAPRLDASSADNLFEIELAGGPRHRPHARPRRHPHPRRRDGRRRAQHLPPSLRRSVPCRRAHERPEHGRGSAPRADGLRRQPGLGRRRDLHGGPPALVGGAVDPSGAGGGSARAGPRGGGPPRRAGGGGRGRRGGVLRQRRPRGFGGRRRHGRHRSARRAGGPLARGGERRPAPRARRHGARACGSRSAGHAALPHALRTPLRPRDARALRRRPRARRRGLRAALRRSVPVVPENAGRPTAAPVRRADAGAVPAARATWRMYCTSRSLRSRPCARASQLRSPISESRSPIR